MTERRHKATMALHERVKTALDETRTLILGAQILLGFQFQGVFLERFEALPPHAQAMVGWALALMLLALGLLIAPSTFHRLAERGESSGRMGAVTGRLTAAALLPFAGALGLDLAIALERVLGDPRVAAAGGAGFALLALAAWFGAGGVMTRRGTGAAERRKAESERGAREPAPLHARIEHMLTEARVILPGAQALLGFQLIIVMTAAFERLPPSSRLVHGAALLAVALAVVLLIAPAALHRIAWAGEDSEDLLRLGGRVTVAALVPLALGVAGDAYVVFARIADSPRFGAAAAAAVALALLGLWFAWPLAARRKREGVAAGERRAGPEGEDQPSRSNPSALQPSVPTPWWTKNSPSGS
jgi:hypothetical protein